ncbi:MAG: hypothetical protein EA424_25205, partial [Planctomycetaceae bacterium]
MSDSKSQDHWKALALLLDVNAPADPEPSEEPTEENLIDSPSSEADQGEGQDRDTDGGLSPQAPITAEPTGTAEPTEPTSTPKRPTRSRPRPKPATVDTSHWRGLAGELGIEVPEEEPEPEPEPEPETDEPEAEVEPVDDRADDDSVQSAAVMPWESQVSDPEPEGDVEAADVEFDDPASDDPASDGADHGPPSTPVA